jgi:Fic family protein
MKSADLVETLVAALAEAPEGLGIDRLVRRMESAASKRTIQRAISDLVAAGRVVAEGQARARRYRLAPVVGRIGIVAKPGVLHVAGETYVPLSPSGSEVRTLVRRSTTDRTPVGYRREFLDAYRPGESAYLPPETQAHLRRLGATSDSQRAAGTYARNMLQRLLIDLAWASSRLEGNTYSLLDTERLIAHGQAAEGKESSETQMILNHKAAIEFLVDPADDPSIRPITIRNLHALLADNLLPDPAAGGRLRTAAVAIGGSVYLPLESGPAIEECFAQVLTTASAIQDPFEQSFFLMVHLPYLQPFDDVNKRVSRLAANIPFIRHNLCPLSFVDVPERAYVDGTLGIYENNRVELLRDVFVWAYERSCQQYAAVRQSLGEPDQFRLQYRSQLTDVVQQIVRNLASPDSHEIRDAASTLRVPSEHLDHFVRLAQVELQSLHEGNFARYRLRPSEYRAWAESRGLGKD